MNNKPDQKFLMLSSRNDKLTNIPNFDPKNSTTIPSDPIYSYSIDQKSGKLTLVDAFPAGGMVPRHFSLNYRGNLVSVGLQQDSRVVIIRRNPTTGKLTDIIANATVAGQVTCVIFDDDTPGNVQKRRAGGSRKQVPTIGAA
jgi:6-phosphogluconolactonase (cycloisomerase 2 family)